MRVFCVAAAALLVAVPASAQSGKDVSGPKTLKPWMVACADLPVTTAPTFRSTITGVYKAGDGEVVAGPRDEVMINRHPDDGLAVGQRWVVRRAQTTFYGFGGRQEGFARVRTAGTIVITAIDENNARATIDFACTSIVAGDYLDAYVEPELPTTATQMMEPDFDERFKVLEGTDGAQLFGDGDTLSVDRGATHGMAVGQRLAFYRDRRDGMPLFYLADGVVQHVSELTSKVVVVKAIDGVTTQDVVVYRRPKP
jgi:hypothetical protein